MGLSVVGSTLSWDETEKLAKFVLELGIKQYINIYRRWKDRSGDIFKWGDEVCDFWINQVLKVVLSIFCACVAFKGLDDRFTCSLTKEFIQNT